MKSTAGIYPPQNQLLWPPSTQQQHEYVDSVQGPFLVGPQSFGTSVPCPQTNVDGHLPQGWMSMTFLALVGCDATIATTSPAVIPKRFHEVFVVASPVLDEL